MFFKSNQTHPYMIPFFVVCWRGVRKTGFQESTESFFKCLSVALDDIMEEGCQ